MNAAILLLVLMVATVVATPLDMVPCNNYALVSPDIHARGSVILSPKSRLATWTRLFNVYGASFPEKASPTACLDAVRIAYAYALSLPCVHHTTTNINMTLSPGVHSFNADGMHSFVESTSLNLPAALGVFTFDAQGDPNATWLIVARVGIRGWAYLYPSKHVFVNGANAMNVYWVSEGSFVFGFDDLAPSQSYTGVFLANSATITDRTSSAHWTASWTGVIYGRLLTTQNVQFGLPIYRWIRQTTIAYNQEALPFMF